MVRRRSRRGGGAKQRRGAAHNSAGVGLAMFGLGPNSVPPAPSVVAEPTRSGAARAELGFGFAASDGVGRADARPTPSSGPSSGRRRLRLHRPQLFAWRPHLRFDQRYAHSLTSLWLSAIGTALIASCVALVLFTRQTSRALPLRSKGWGVGQTRRDYPQKQNLVQRSAFGPNSLIFAIWARHPAM